MPGKNDEEDSNAYGMTYFRLHRTVTDADESVDSVEEFLDFTGNRHAYDNKLSVVASPSVETGEEIQVTLYSCMPTKNSEISSIDDLWVVEQLGIIKADNRVFFDRLPAGYIKIVVTDTAGVGTWDIHTSEPML